MTAFNREMIWTELGTIGYVEYWKARGAQLLGLLNKVHRSKHRVDDWSKANLKVIQVLLFITYEGRKTGHFTADFMTKIDQLCLKYGVYDERTT